MRWHPKKPMGRLHRCSILAIVLFMMLALAAWDKPDARTAFILTAIVIEITWIVGQLVMVIFRASARLAGAVLPLGLARRRESPGRQLAGDMIERWCRETGWVLIGQAADHYRVRSGDVRSPVTVEVRYTERQVNVVFQAWFSVRFSLEKPPAGLFARVLLRNASLKWASWGMCIGESCAACIYVGASIPQKGMDAPLFSAVCGEIANEIRAFHQELHDKFAYGLGEIEPEAMPRDVRGGLPMRRGDTLPGVSRSW